MAVAGRAGQYENNKCSESKSQDAACEIANSAVTCQNVGRPCKVCLVDAAATVIGCVYEEEATCVLHSGYMVNCGKSVEGTCIVIDSQGNLGCIGPEGLCDKKVSADGCDLP